jgi:hypothetical protein
VFKAFAVLVPACLGYECYAKFFHFMKIFAQEQGTKKLLSDFKDLNWPKSQHEYFGIS